MSWSNVPLTFGQRHVCNGVRATLTAARAATPGRLAARLPWSGPEAALLSPSGLVRGQARRRPLPKMRVISSTMIEPMIEPISPDGWKLVIDRL